MLQPLELQDVIQSYTNLSEEPTDSPLTRTMEVVRKQLSSSQGGRSVQTRRKHLSSGKGTAQLSSVQAMGRFKSVKGTSYVQTMDQFNSG